MSFYTFLKFARLTAMQRASMQIYHAACKINPSLAISYETRDEMTIAIEMRIVKNDGGPNSNGVYITVNEVKPTL
jgi:hypothetical protein